MNVKHDRAASRKTRSPDVQCLRTVRTVNERGILVLPGHGRLRRQPTVFAARVLSVRNSFESKHAAIKIATNWTAMSLSHCTARCGASSRLLLMHASFNAV